MGVIQSIACPLLNKEHLMKFRKRLSNKASKRYFSKTAGGQHVHPKNARTMMPMRGGIRA